jgi:hypothetical protein
MEINQQMDINIEKYLISIESVYAFVVFNPYRNLNKLLFTLSALSTRYKAKCSNVSHLTNARDDYFLFSKRYSAEPSKLNRLQAEHAN